MGVVSGGGPKHNWGRFGILCTFTFPARRSWTWRATNGLFTSFAAWATGVGAVSNTGHGKGVVDGGGVERKGGAMVWDKRGRIGVKFVGEGTGRQGFSHRTCSMALQSERGI